MQLSVTWKCARAAVVELHDGNLFKTGEPWQIFINDVPRGETDRVVTYIDNLEPQTVYRVRFERDGEVATTVIVTEDETFTLGVRAFGAAGDGVRDDTTSLQAAIMACPEKGRVLIPAGDYLISTLFLKSGISIELAEGATLKARFDRENLAYLPENIEGVPGTGYAGSGILPMGTWEGESRRMFCGAIMGLSVHDTVIYGHGVIDGQASFDEDNWWFEAKRIRIAARPRLIFLSECKNMNFAGITVRNSPSWNIHPVLSSRLGFWCLNIEGPKVPPTPTAWIRRAAAASPSRAATSPWAMTASPSRAASSLCPARCARPAATCLSSSAICTTATAPSRLVPRFPAACADLPRAIACSSAPTAVCVSRPVAAAVRTPWWWACASRTSRWTACSRRLL